MINIETTTGDLKLVHSAVVAFQRAEGVCVKIGSISAVFEVAKGSDDPPNVAREARSDELTLAYCITGKIPDAPFMFGMIKPENIGTLQGVPISLWWRIGYTSREKDVLEISYSVFTENKNESTASTEENHGG